MTTSTQKVFVSLGPMWSSAPTRSINRSTQQIGIWRIIIQDNHTTKFPGCKAFFAKFKGYLSIALIFIR